MHLNTYDVIATTIIKFHIYTPVHPFQISGQCDLIPSFTGSIFSFHIRSYIAWTWLFVKKASEVADSCFHQRHMVTGNFMTGHHISKASRPMDLLLTYCTNRIIHVRNVLFFTKLRNMSKKEFEYSDLFLSLKYNTFYLNILKLINFSKKCSSLICGVRGFLTYCANRRLDVTILLLKVEKYVYKEILLTDLFLSLKYNKFYPKFKSA